MYRAGYDVFIRMSKDSFDKMVASLKEIVQNKPKSDLATKIIDEIKDVRIRTSFKISACNPLPFLYFVCTKSGLYIFAF